MNLMKFECWTRHTSAGSISHNAAGFDYQLITTKAPTIVKFMACFIAVHHYWTTYWPSQSRQHKITELAQSSFLWIILSLTSYLYSNAIFWSMTELYISAEGWIFVVEHSHSTINSRHCQQPPVQVKYNTQVHVSAFMFVACLVQFNFIACHFVVILKYPVWLLFCVTKKNLHFIFNKLAATGVTTCFCWRHRCKNIQEKFLKT